MGVPITFLGKHNPEQFEIVAELSDDGEVLSPGRTGKRINGVEKYARIIIRRTKESVTP